MPVSLVLTADTHVHRARDPPALWPPSTTPRTSSCTRATGSASTCSTSSRPAQRLVAVRQQRPRTVPRAPAGGRDRRDRGLRFAVVHETGDAKGREPRCAARFPDADVLVFGQPHPLGHDRADRSPAAEPRLAHRPPSAAARHVRHGGRRGRRAAHVVFHPVPRRTTSPALPDGAVAVLACPVCGDRLAVAADGSALRCAAGHSFDRARRATCAAALGSPGAVG